MTLRQGRRGIKMRPRGRPRRGHAGAHIDIRTGMPDAVAAMRAAFGIGDGTVRAAKARLRGRRFQAVTWLVLRSVGVAVVCCTPVAAQVGVGPQPAPAAPAIAAPRDVAFEGVVGLSVDARDTAHKIFAVHETVPVAAGAEAPGEMVLLYPRWETGSHAATGSVANLAGLIVRAAGRRLEWRRDPVDVFAFWVAVPAGAPALEVDFQYLSPLAPRAGAVVMTPDIVVVPWQRLVLVPAGWFLRDIQVQADLTLPAGFQSASSLETARVAGGTVFFRTATVETLVDSPVYAGRWFRRLVLTPPGEAQVALDVVADRAADLEAAPGELARWRAVVAQTLRLFGSRHYDHYDLLVSVSDILPSSGGLEHLRSGEINLPADFLRAPQDHLLGQGLLAHEYVHSWNGRLRQPADLWTPDLNTPMRDSLLWVYEGLTELWGDVLAVRAGLLTAEQARDVLALAAATAQTRAGRSWKSLADSNNDPLFDAGHPVSWRDWQRREDYYGEGALLWLDVDAQIRQRTGGARSLDDFARAFFGPPDGGQVVHTYTEEQVCAALARIAPFDWQGYFRGRLQSHDADQVLDGLARAGYRLVYAPEPTAAFRESEAEDGVAADLSFSIGLAVAKTGVVKSVAWEGEAFRAGLAPGVQITAVDGRPFDAGDLVQAVARTTDPLDITFVQDGQTRTARLAHQDGLLYPRLARLPGTADGLAALWAPLGAVP